MELYFKYAIFLNEEERNISALPLILLGKAKLEEVIAE
jgi:hypothetical protein